MLGFVDDHKFDGEVIATFAHQLVIQLRGARSDLKAIEAISEINHRIRFVWIGREGARNLDVNWINTLRGWVGQFNLRAARDFYWFFCDGTAEKTTQGQ